MYSFPSLALFLIFAFFLVKGAIGVVGKERESSARVSTLEEKARTLASREEELKYDISHLQTEEGIRDEVRERFSATEEGEYVAIIVDDKTVATSTDTSLWPWYKKLWNAIIGE